MTRRVLVGFLLGLFGVVGMAVAADKNDPSGTWKWTTKFKDKEFEQTMKIKNDSGKVTGTITAGKNEAKIEDGKFKNGELSFTVTRERKGNKFTQKYKGKVSDDTIKGAITSEFNGKEFKRDWEAKRVK